MGKISIDKIASQIKQLVISGQKGCPEFQALFGEVYSEYSETIFLYCRARNLSEEDSQDTVHEVFMAIINKIEKYDENRRFFPWFWGFVMIKIKQKFFHNKKNKHDSLNTEDGQNKNKLDTLKDEMTDTENEVVASLFKLTVKEILNDFSTVQRVIISLAFFEGYKNKEIAAVLDKSQNDIAVEKRRALFKLQEKLSEKGIERSFLCS